MTDGDVHVFGIEDDALDARIRRIAREEIASLAGLVLRRSQDDDAEHARRLASIFGEALNDFTTETEPGT